MLTPAFSKVREFLGSWKNLLALATLPLLGAWIYSRVWMVNPVILGDEYLYSMNARKVQPWDAPVAGDFSNYMFNFIYRGTNLCGDAFYTCGKLLNIIFFLGFVFTLFIVACRYLPFWSAYAFMVFSALSPLSVYTSMFLPEAMFFFFIGLVLVAVLRAMQSFNLQNWALAGGTLGLASLVKPHAWLSAVGVVITLIVVGLFNRDLGIKKTFLAGVSLVAGAALARVVVGVIIAGPKALDFFGQYLGVSTLNQMTLGTGGQQSIAGNEGPSTPLEGVFSLFGDQLNIHIVTMSAVMGVAIVGMIAGTMDLGRTRKLSPSNALALFGLIWLLSLTIEIVIFTGWVTGSGDDHSTRVLLRYYEFLFLVGPLAGLGALAARHGDKMSAWIRWAMSAFLIFLITPAFSGFFGTLTIQIADAPTLAGLITDERIFGAVAVMGFGSLVLFASFPRFSQWALFALLPVTMVGMGFQTQSQYQDVRGFDNTADVVGKYLRSEFSSDELDKTWVLSTSRFEATNVAIWADSKFLKYDLFLDGSSIDSTMYPEGVDIAVVTGNLSLTSWTSILVSGDGFTVYRID